MPSLRARATRAAFDVGLRGLQWYRERDTGPITPDTSSDVLEQAATNLRELMQRLTSLDVLPFGAEEEQATGTPQPSWWFTPKQPTEGRVVLHLHGGAYVAGSHTSHRGLASMLARTASAQVLLPEYRLAPEDRFPAALDDSMATYRWLLEERGCDPAHVAVSGDSAGGGLAVALALSIRDADLPLPAGLALLSPWVDLTGSGDSVRINAGADILDGALIASAGSMYAPEDPSDPLASPLFGDLTGLPPMLVHVGGNEVLLDDAVRLVDRARDRGVEASVGVFEGMWHVFQAMPGIPEGTQSLRELGAFLRRVLDAAQAAHA